MHPIIGISPAIIQLKKMINQLASTRLNVLITGETGVGKEVIAQNLFPKSKKLKGKFVKVNCAALPETLLESELFGFEKGSFTDAHKKHNGKFLSADKGVLFLDEVGDMPMGLQSKILHVLQDGKFSPIGADKDIQSNAWIIAATNHILEERINNKMFREDLFYRLNIINIHIPPLRHRKEDILHLFEYYFDQYKTDYSFKVKCKPNNKLVEKLADYHWPGNVRQLQNCIKKYMVLNSWEQVMDELSVNRSQSLTGRRISGENNILNTNPLSQQQDPIVNHVSTFAEVNLNSSDDLENFSLKKIRSHLKIN